eukprot:TRINITY_DN3755_c0_g1_i4.p1 TRINITY_DN3755_c0_g1~~TRINITY_DN3755_c0_g1_i4.p1  ORF type:complete len:1151 (-),score=368.32 TRINITY_DN3755_c0_g1_i4:22-3474(-)
MAFLFGFFLGVVCTVLFAAAGLIFFVYVFLADKPSGEDGKSKLEHTLLQEVSKPPEVTPEAVLLNYKKVFEDPKRRDFFSQDRIWKLQFETGGEEKCEWFNLFLQRIFMEYVAANLEEKYRMKLNKKFAQTHEDKDKPKFVGSIYITKINAGSFLPLIRPIKILSPTRAGELRGEFDVIYEGGFNCIITAELWLNLPNKSRVASLPISLTVMLEHLSGRMLFVCPPGPDPLCTLSFYNEPFSKFSVVPAFGINKKLQNIPALSKFIVNKLQNILRKDMVLPNGICFHLPLKESMSTGRDMNITTVRKVRAMYDSKAKNYTSTSLSNPASPVVNDTRKAESPVLSPHAPASAPVDRRTKETAPTIPTLVRSTYSLNQEAVSSPSQKDNTFSFSKMKEKVKEAKKKLQEKVAEERKFLSQDKYNEIRQRKKEKESQSTSSTPKVAGSTKPAAPAEITSKPKRVENPPVKSSWDWSDKNILNSSWQDRDDADYLDPLHASSNPEKMKEKAETAPKSKEPLPSSEAKSKPQKVDILKTSPTSADVPTDPLSLLAATMDEFFSKEDLDDSLIKQAEENSKGETPKVPPISKSGSADSLDGVFLATTPPKEIASMPSTPTSATSPTPSLPSGPTSAPPTPTKTSTSTPETRLSVVEISPGEFPKPIEASPEVKSAAKIEKIPPPVQKTTPPAENAEEPVASPRKSDIVAATPEEIKREPDLFVSTPAEKTQEDRPAVESLSEPSPVKAIEQPPEKPLLEAPPPVKLIADMPATEYTHKEVSEEPTLEPIKELEPVVEPPKEISELENVPATPEEKTPLLKADETATKAEPTSSLQSSILHQQISQDLTRKGNELFGRSLSSHSNSIFDDGDSDLFATPHLSTSMPASASSAQFYSPTALVKSEPFGGNSPRTPETGPKSQPVFPSSDAIPIASGSRNASVRNPAKPTKTQDDDIFKEEPSDIFEQVFKTSSFKASASPVDLFKFSPKEDSMSAKSTRPSLFDDVPFSPVAPKSEKKVEVVEVPKPTPMMTSVTPVTPTAPPPNSTSSSAASAPRKNSGGSTLSLFDDPIFSTPPVTSSIGFQPSVASISRQSSLEGNVNRTRLFDDKPSPSTRATDSKHASSEDADDPLSFLVSADSKKKKKKEKKVAGDSLFSDL